MQRPLAQCHHERWTQPHDGRHAEHHEQHREVADEHGCRNKEPEQQRMNQVGEQMDHRLEAHENRERRSNHLAEQQPGALQRTLRPPELLVLQSVQVAGDLTRHDHVPVIDATPTRELRPIAEVEVFGERAGLPATGALDGGATPDARGPVEVEEEPRSEPRLLLDGAA